MTKEYWENVALDMNSILDSTENNEQCLSVLSLSYSYLPVYLKPCFLLMGAFPEDLKISLLDVVGLWIAEGFIESFKNKRLEDVAENYLCDLYERNLILLDRLGYDGKIIYFKVHDLVRELFLKIAKKEELLNVFDSPQAIRKERRVVISGKVAEGNFLGLKYFWCDDLIYWNAESCSFPAVQVLRLKGLSKLDEFPSGIGEIPTLKWFELENCSECSTISAMRTLVEQVEEQGNEDLELYVTFQGDEETLESFKNKVRLEGLTSKNIVLHFRNATRRS